MSSHFLSENFKNKTHKIIILPLVSFGCETWSLTLREEYIENVSEQGAEENIWTSEEVAGGWKRLHNEELCNFYFTKYC
jgi:hypothetical protein